MPGWIHRTTRWLPPLIAVGLCGAAAWALHHELKLHPYSELRGAVLAIPPRQILHALLLTVASYVVLTGYDALAMKDLGIPLSYRRTAFASFVGYVFSHNIGLSVLGGGAARYRLYSAFGLSAVHVFKIVTFCAATFWLGMLFLTGGVLALDPTMVAPLLHLPPWAVRVIGVVLIGVVVGYILACRFRRKPLEFRGYSFTLPTFGIALVQIGLSALDWLVGAGVLYAVMPADLGLPFHRFLAVYLAAIVLAAASHVPGGIGVFESLVLSMLSSYPNHAALIGSLIAFRGVYYLLPLGFGAVALGAHELGQRLVGLRRVTSLLGKWGPAVVPRVLALSIFVSGVVLLGSGATPRVALRMEWLASAAPPVLVEVAHLFASIVGVLLLLLAQALQQRIDRAWVASAALLAAGIALSLLKGLDWEEALILAVALAALLPSRREFTRQASLLGDRFAGGWVAALVVVLGCTAWLAFFSYEHLEFSGAVGWQFTASGDAPRSLRATVSAAVVLLGVGLTRLLRPAAPDPAPPDAAALAQALPIVHASRDTLAWLALLGDKTVLFDKTDHRKKEPRDRAQEHSAFLMYAVQGRSWVALGDPVGPDDRAAALVWEFRELAHRERGAAVFYQVRPDHLPLYLELGCTLLELGEEARVPLESFTLEGAAGDAREPLRATVRRVEEAGGRFEVVSAEQARELVPELGRVSFDWLEAKKTREQGFSLGRFEPDYLHHFPMAIVRKGRRIVAFASLRLGGDREELACDLMRHDQAAPPGVMDYLFVQLMLFGRREGYRWFNLGMAPLAGLDPKPLAPLWNKIGSALFQHGEPFDDFAGLRQYKEKFAPVWRPRYLATPGGLQLPRVLIDVATLIGGGVTASRPR